MDRGAYSPHGVAKSQDGYFLWVLLSLQGKGIILSLNQQIFFEHPSLTVFRLGIRVHTFQLAIFPVIKEFIIPQIEIHTNNFMKFPKDK